MIQVLVEIFPGGFSDARRTLGIMHIANVSDLAPRSDYEVRVSESANPLAGTGLRRCNVQVRDHDRHQSVWALIARAAEAAAKAEYDEL
jgi:hypothetical protein